MVCRKLFAQPLDPAGFIDKECVIRNGIRKGLSHHVWWKLRRYLWINGTSFDLDGG